MASKRNKNRPGSKRPAGSRSSSKPAAPKPETAKPDEVAQAPTAADETKDTAETTSGEGSADKGSADKGSPDKAAEKPAKPSAGKPSRKSSGSKSGGRPGGKSGGSRPNNARSAAARRARETAAPKNRPWGMITLIGGAALALIGLVVVAAVTAPKSASDIEISGLKDYGAEGAEWVEVSDHVSGKVEYATSPPLGGEHNTAWQTCNGVAYDAPIPNEHAVHSLEHGAVWITYQPDLAQDEIDKLAKKVTGKDYTLMSPYEGLESPISLQSWGVSLNVDSSSDERIDDFIKKYRLTSSREPGAACSGGVNATGDAPIEAGQ